MGGPTPPPARALACKWCFEMELDVDDDKTNIEIWYCNCCKIIVTNSDM